MPDRPDLRPAGERPPSSRLRRGPGPAVVMVASYAILFGASLWILRARTGFFRAGGAPGGPPKDSAAPSPPMSRASLLEAGTLAPLARAEYFRRLSRDCCPCGCDLNLRDCLVSDQACAKSPELASALLREVE